MIELGIYSDLSSEDYHNHKNSYSRSVLMEMQKSPYHFWAKYINPARPKKEPTRNMILGSAFHALILEPKKFADLFAVEPEKVLLKHVGREAYDEYKLQCDAISKMNKTVLTMEEMIVLLEMENALFKNERAKELIFGADFEKSFFWKDKESGLMLKSRPDILFNNLYVDLKTCSDASPRAYQNEMISYGYHIQAAMLRDAIRALEGRDMSNTINLCIETKYPYAVAIYPIDEAAIDYAEEKYKSICLELKECLEKDEWLSYEIQTIGMPRWAL